MTVTARAEPGERGAIDFRPSLTAPDYNSPMDQAAEQDPRVYLAAERTLLAWLRTGLGLIGVGFAVSRFGLFLRQMTAGTSAPPVHNTGLSVWSGIALVGLGVLVNVSAVMRHYQLVRELSTGTWKPGQVSTHAVLLGAILAIIGLAMATYLITLR